MTEEKIVPVILCGGAGRRLWPLSQPHLPKQFLSLFGGETMLQATLRRVTGEMFAEPVIVCSAAQVDLVQQQSHLAEAPRPHIIAEPAARNTGAAITSAALLAKDNNLLLVLPSDHFISELDTFQAAVAKGIGPAQSDWLVTFGIAPDRPETGYGYIELGEEIAPGALRATRFEEKPDQARAEEFVRSGHYLWNGGIFLFRAAAMLDALEAHAPAVLASTRLALARAETSGHQTHPDEKLYSKIPAGPIDKLVMEKAGHIAVVPMSVGWSDIGSWDALAEVSHEDSNGNCLLGQAHALDVRNSYIRAESRSIVVIGVEDLIVVETADGIIILPKGQSQRIREAEELIRDERRR